LFDPRTEQAGSNNSASELYWEVPNSNVSHDTIYPVWGFSMVSPSSSGQMQVYYPN